MRAARAHRAWSLALGCAAVAAVVAAVVAPLPARVALLALAAALLVLERVTTTNRHRRELAQALHLARTDELTGLANRRALLTAIGAALAAGAPAGLMLVDLDGFKTVNDTHGHLIGDHVLRVVARRLRETLTGHFLVARLGGDEFAVLAQDSDRYALPALTARVRAALARPVAVPSGGPVFLGASIGTALTGPGTTAADLLRQVDTAMYRAKTPARATDNTPAPDPGTEPPDPPGWARAAIQALAAATAANRQTTSALDDARRHTTGLTGHPFGDHPR